MKTGPSFSASEPYEKLQVSELATRSSYRLCRMPNAYRLTGPGSLQAPKRVASFLVEVEHVSHLSTSTVPLTLPWSMGDYGVEYNRKTTSDNQGRKAHYACYNR
jgi:hypothetical protein